MAAETAHTRRLRTDFAKVQALMDRAGEALSLETSIGIPPTRYVVRYRCKSVAQVVDGQAEFQGDHHVEIKIPSGYPLEPPVVRILTAIFHPHVFTSGIVCLGSRWQVGEGMDNLLLRVGAILRFEPAYLDFKSPANFAAAQWAAGHLGEFPLEPDPFAVPAAASPSRSVTWNDVG